MNEENKEDLCQKCECRPADEWHTCPYNVEINDDYEFMCNCCDECKDECRLDI